MLELDAQGAHFRSAVEAQQFAPFSRRVITQCLDRPEPAQCHEGQKQKDACETVKASRQVKVLGKILTKSPVRARRTPSFGMSRAQAKRGPSSPSSQRLPASRSSVAVAPRPIG